ncbi:MAG: FAD-dependent oxidoreductase [Ilumatobacteraceae bacterium]
MQLRDLSLWHATLPPDDPLEPRPALAGDLEADVAIVGAGYTGLWTAHYLRRRHPDMRIVVLESEVAGFGASGRNGGWCSALLPMGFEAMAHEHGRDAAPRMQRAMNATVDEVGAVAASEGIECHFSKGGTVRAARNPAHIGRMQAEVAEYRAFGFGEDGHPLAGRRRSDRDGGDVRHARRGVQPALRGDPPGEARPRAGTRSRRPVCASTSAPG